MEQWKYTVTANLCYWHCNLGWTTWCISSTAISLQRFYEQDDIASTFHFSSSSPPAPYESNRSSLQRAGSPWLVAVSNTAFLTFAAYWESVCLSWSCNIVLIATVHSHSMTSRNFLGTSPYSPSSQPVRAYFFFWTHFRLSHWMATHLHMHSATPTVYFDLEKGVLTMSMIEQNECQEDCGCKSYSSGDFKQQGT